MQRIYEWRWTRPGHPDKVTRSTRTAGIYKRLAAKLGGEVTRYPVGWRFRASEIFG